MAELGLSQSKNPSRVGLWSTVLGAVLPMNVFWAMKRNKLHQRVVAEVNHLASDKLDLRQAVSNLASASSAPLHGTMQAARRVGSFFGKACGASQVFSRIARRAGVLLCCADADWASDMGSRRSPSGGVVSLGRWTLQLLIEETAECCAFELGKRAVLSDLCLYSFVGISK